MKNLARLSAEEIEEKMYPHLIKGKRKKLKKMKYHENYRAERKTKQLLQIGA